VFNRLAYITGTPVACSFWSADCTIACSRLLDAFLCWLPDTFGPRFSGTTVLENVLDYMKATQQADGLYVTECAVHKRLLLAADWGAGGVLLPCCREPTMIPRWVRGNEYATMLQPRVKVSAHFSRSNCWRFRS
jgi:hypothetical protein